MMNRFWWELLGFIRSLSMSVAMVLFAAGIIAITEPFPWIAMLVVAVVAVLAIFCWQASGVRRKARLVTLKEGHGVEDAYMPAWLDDARCYYSEIGGDSSDPVRVVAVPESAETSSELPGALCLRLEPRARASALVHVLGADGREEGIIRPEGLVPGVRYVMYRNGKPAWKLSVRSILRKRHALELANGDLWTFETPFFWWQNLTGTAAGVPRVLGGLVLPTTTVWGMWIEPGWDSFDVLAALAFMHRQWWHW